MAERQLAHTPYLSALDGLSSRQIIESDIAVRHTCDTAGWVTLTELWGAREDSLKEDLLRVNPGAEAVKYAALIAQINGLREAREAVNALAKVAEAKRREATDE
jgi:hypothetical protein